MEIKRISYFDRRFYIYDKEGREVVLNSVTEILNIKRKVFLEKWRGQIGNNEADKVLRDAQNKGSMVHNAIDLYNKGFTLLYNEEKNPDYTEEEIQRFYDTLKKVFVVTNQSAWIEVIRIISFFQLYNVEIEQSEMTVYNLVENYAGTLDAIIKINAEEMPKEYDYKIENGLYLVDYKTGSAISKEYKMQLAAYYKALPAEYQATLNGGLILHTNGTAKSKIEGFSVIKISLEEIEKYYKEFLIYKQMYELDFPPGSRTIKKIPTIISKKTKLI